MPPIVQTRACYGIPSSISGGWGAIEFIGGGGKRKLSLLPRIRATIASTIIGKGRACRFRQDAVYRPPIIRLTSSRTPGGTDCPTILLLLLRVKRIGE